MKILFYLIIGVLALFSLYLLFLAFKSKKPFKFIFLNAVFGIGVLVLIHFTKRYTGVSLPINQYTVLGSGILGIPCSLAFLILNFILI